MNEFKGTPGPWTVDTTTTFGAYGVWTDYATQPGHDGAGYASQICSMFTGSFKQTDKATRPTRDANARLIAAAPDLLAACIAYLDTYRGTPTADNSILYSLIEREVAKALGTPAEESK